MIDDNTVECFGGGVEKNRSDIFVFEITFSGTDCPKKTQRQNTEKKITGEKGARAFRSVTDKILVEIQAREKNRLKKVFQIPKQL